MKSASRTKGTKVRGEPKTIRTADVDMSAAIPWRCC